MQETDPLQLLQYIQPETGFENDEGYKDVLADKANEIRDKTKIINTIHTIVNRKIGPTFSYSDLEQIITDIYVQQTTAFKLNLSIAFILYNTINHEFRYYYNSTNNLLFEKAITIEDRQDLEKLMKKIVNLDLATSCYLKKPSSSWVLAGLTNVEIQIYNMKDVPIG